MRRPSLAIPLAAALGALLLAACPKSKPAAPPSDTAPASTPKADGERCLAAGDCASGICEGEGCADDQPGTCAPASRACTKDFRAYCGCDGVTFHGSGSCPGARFAHREECPADQAAP